MVFRFSNLAALRFAVSAAARRRGPLPPHCLPLLLSPPTDQHNHCYYIPKRSHMGHAHDHHGGGEEGGASGEAAERIFRLGLAADIALAAGKGITGYISGSTAIAADAAHSLSDIVLSGVALLSYKAARVPGDHDHPYGHGKFESLGALGISGMLLVTAGGIAWHAVDVLQGILSSAPDIISTTMDHSHHNHQQGGHHHGIDLEHPVLALSMTVLAISVKEGLYHITKRAGERYGSGLMKANAWHHRSDAVSSVVALIGVGGSIIGVPFLDPLAGLLVSGMILKAGVETGYQSILELMDAAVDPSILEPIKKTIVQVPGVKGCHRLRGRKAGSFLYLDVHIEVDPFLSVSAAHDIGETVRHQIQKNHSQVAEVFIHIDPKYSGYPSLEERKIMEKGSERSNLNNTPKQQEAEAIVSNILSLRYSKKISLEHLMLHCLQGQVFLQVQVSMPPEILIRDAMNLAKEAEKEILKADSGIDQVSIQLRLGHQITQLQLPARNEETKLR